MTSASPSETSDIIAGMMPPIGELPLDATRIVRLYAEGAGLRIVIVTNGVEGLSMPVADRSPDTIKRIAGVVREIVSRQAAPAPPVVLRDPIAYGKEAAATHTHFMGAYTIRRTDRGTIVDPSPDGRTTGTCDRCGVAISNVYVFRDPKAGTRMHVGIDCAAKMGVPAEELRRARHYFSDIAKEHDRARRRASAEAARAAEEAERVARLNANAALVEELSMMRNHPAATAWEVGQIDRAVSMVASEGPVWLDEDVDSERMVRMRDALAAIRDRISLCDTSRPVAGDKKGALTGEFRVYRKPIVYEPFHYGSPPTYVNFLTDDAGNAFVYKGTKGAAMGSRIRATFTVGEADTRDGLTSTTLSRPRKATIARMEQGENGPDGGWIDFGEPREVWHEW